MVLHCPFFGFKRVIFWFYMFPCIGFKRVILWFYMFPYVGFKRIILWFYISLISLNPKP